MNTLSAVSTPLLYDSQLKFRLGLAKKRLEHYPLDTMDFVMMDLERPALRTRHAHQCTYDLAEGIDGEHIDRLPELYRRIMNNRKPDGRFGILYEEPWYVGTHLLSGLVEYYELSGDLRALNAAEDAAMVMLSQGDDLYARFDPKKPNAMYAWITEGFAELYRVTKKDCYLEAVRRIAYECLGGMQHAHSHGYTTTLRGILKGAVYSGDRALFRLVQERRQEILDNGVLPNGDICESYPRSRRNEGCSIADWVMLNLLYGHYADDPHAYELAEHTLWNALCFNQFVTGGFGHRYISRRGYRTYIEEAWWCCTQNAGTAMALAARHAVTLRNGKLKLNLWIPGKFTLPGGITVTVTTGFPTKAKTILHVTGTKEDIDLRIPSYFKETTCRRVETDLGYTLYIDAKLGHYTEKVKDGVLLKYGPLVIAPMTYVWDQFVSEPDPTTVPEGYTHDSVAGDGYALELGTPDENGFYHFDHNPLPVWPIFEEGEMAGIGGGEAASAYVPVRFSSGELRMMYFQPLCSATSNLTLLDLPVVFDLKE